MRAMKMVVVVVGFVGATFATAAPAVADEKTGLVERIVAKADPSRLEVLVTTLGSNGAPKFETTRVPDVAAAKRVVRGALGRSGVVGVEMNRLVKAAAINDPLYRYQWPMDVNHFYYPSIYSLTSRDTLRPRIAIVDSGVQRTHPDLVGHVHGGYNAITGTTSQTDDCGHGTHVAGIIGAGLNNGRGTVGLAQRAYIRPVKVLSHQGGLFGGQCVGYTDDVVRGIMWAATGSPIRAQIINLSIESELPSPAESHAILYAQNHGVVVVAAAGNGGDGKVVYPAGYANVLGVAAVGPTSTAPYWARASFSNYGALVDVAAPGVDVLSTVPSSNPDCPASQQYTSGYCYLSGTSMASPYAAATLSLAMLHCRWSARTAMSWIQRTASSYPSKSIYTGYGFINPRKLLRCGR